MFTDDATIRDEYKAKNLEMHLITHIQLYLKEAIILLAYGNYEKCEKVILDALAFSKKHQVYYKTDEFYRILSYQKSSQLIKNNIYIT